jgi:hypothetical protein
MVVAVVQRRMVVAVVQRKTLVDAVAVALTRQLLLQAERECVTAVVMMMWMRVRVQAS